MKPMSKVILVLGWVFIAACLLHFIPPVRIDPHFETKAQRLARYRQEDARDNALQEVYYRNQKILQALWKDKCPNGKDPAITICADGPPEYLPITYFWGHTLEPMR